MFNENDRYHEFCDRLCTFIMSRELKIPFQRDVSLFHDDNGKNIRKNLRLSVVNRHIHYYKQNSAGEEYEIQPEGQLPSILEEYLNLPATEAQLQATEDLLGFPLPPLLRTLYTQVANGGFGPSQGIFGALGGGNEDGWLLTVDYLLQKADKQPIDLSACEHSPIDRNEDYYNSYLAPWEIVVPQGYWPDRLLPIILDGDNMYYYLDVLSDRVFYSQAYSLELCLLANSLEDFFERWMRNNLWDYQHFIEEQ